MNNYHLFDYNVHDAKVIVDNCDLIVSGVKIDLPLIASEMTQAHESRVEVNNQISMLLARIEALEKKVAEAGWKYINI